MVLNSKKSAAWAGLLALSLVGAPTLTAEETTPPAGEEMVVELPFGGMTVAIDPATGKLRQPTPAQARELARQMALHFGRHASEPTRVLQHRNGMLSAVLSPENLDFTVVTVDAEGKLRFQCVDSVEKAAEATLSTPSLEVM